MIPLMNSDLPSHTKKKIAQMTHKQEQFLSTLIVKPCVYLSEIDYYNTELKTTNVDYSSWHSSYVVTFPSHLEKEAEDYITQLPAYLKYFYGEEVLYITEPRLVLSQKIVAKKEGCGPPEGSSIMPVPGST